MHMLIAYIVLASACLAAPAAAQGRQDVDGLRRELEDMRRQLEAAREQYQKQIDTLTERIRKIESQPAAAVEPPRPAESAVGTPAQPARPAVASPMELPAQAGTPSVMDLLTPRQPFALSEPSGKGSLLFDIGVAGDFVAAFSNKKVDDANVGTFPGRENRLFTREVELAFFGAIDPYARAEVRFEAAEEFEDGEREFHVGLSEAHFTLTSLPWGFQAKAGQMRNRFGLLNERHQHDLPQIDRPNALVNFFGEEQLAGPDLSQVRWVGERDMWLGRRRRAAAKMAPPPFESPHAPASIPRPSRARIQG
jgi:hypothetical protein